MKLQERALLTALHLGAWSGQAIDRQVTEEAAEAHKADVKDSGRYSKQLIHARLCVKYWARLPSRGRHIRSSHCRGMTAAVS